MTLRGVLPVIACVCIVAGGCANAPPTQVVRSSTAVHAASLPALQAPATRRFKETLLFAPHAAQVPRMIEALDPREAPATYVLPGAHGDATIDLRFPSSPIELALTPSTSTLLFGASASLDVAVTDAGTPVDDVSIEVALVAPNDHARRSLSPTSSRSLDLRSLFHRDDASGVWTIEVRARGTSHGVVFDRFGTTAIHFAVPTATLASVGEPRALDDGSIEVDAALDVTTHDRLEITAYLTTLDDRPVARANTTATFDPGRSTATLHFDRSALPNDGPFHVRRVRVFSLGANATLATLD